MTISLQRWKEAKKQREVSFLCLFPPLPLCSKSSTVRLIITDYPSIERRSQMLERPPISDDTIHRCMRENYGISAAAITFLPIGYDSTASVFRVDAADGKIWFLKAKSVPVAAASLAVPHFLRGLDVDCIVAPVATGNGALTAPLGDGFTAILYPFVAGRMGADGGLSPQQWTALGQAMGQIHNAVLPATLTGQMRRESFAPLKGELAWTLHREISAAAYTDPISQDLAAFWQERREDIEAILRRAEELGRMAQARQPAIVLCHADIHVWNVLVDPSDGIHIVDWDETILAPKERDLMFLVDGTQPAGTPPHPNEAAFSLGYGPTKPDPVILAFYRYDWVVQEIAEFGRQVLWAGDGGEITRLDGLRHFRALFEPGDVVERAYRAEVGGDVG
jgi:spectinomycin phosphotransferase